MLKVLGKSFGFRVLEPRIKRAWQLEHGCELTDIDKGNIIARYYSQANYLKVLNGGPWLLMGHYLMISKWKPNFKPGDEEVHSTLVWICFPTLPLEMFDDNHLFHIGNAVGKTIKVDRNTVETAHGCFARVFVELNLGKPLPPNVLVWGRKRPVEYEGLHCICFKCGYYGHKMESCGATEDQQRHGPTSTPSEKDRTSGSIAA